MEKIKYLVLMALLTASYVFVQGQNSKQHLRDFPKITVSSFKVYGNCGDCQRRILNAVVLKGVRSAFWDNEDQILTVQYDAKIVQQDFIQAEIAQKGHDTEKYKAPDNVYTKLPACCHYLRKG